jgi:site-specific DNA-methyltransferase (adenine-specific)
MTKTRSGDKEDDHFQTPPSIYNALDKEFNFDCDPCPYHASFDGLDISFKWGKSNFINPPYNRRDKPKFIQRAYNEWKNNNVTCVLLIPAATSTKQFHELILPNAEIRFFKGRIEFFKDGSPSGGKGKHDSMLVIFKRKEKK